MTAPHEIAVAVLGISGRMGRAVTALIDPDSSLRLSGGWCESVAAVDDMALPASVAVSADIAEALVGADVAIDFTLPAATLSVAQACAKAGCALVSGTTGLEPAAERALEAASRSIALLHATNMSAGVHLAAHLAAQAARALNEREWDVEILDIHHRHKRDAPSGTALTLGEVVAGARGRRLEDVRLDGRESQTTARSPGGIGFAAVRGGEVVGEHTVSFMAAYETVEIRHKAADRRVFAAGALRAARWLAGREPGRYTMNDVLGLVKNQ